MPGHRSGQYRNEPVVSLDTNVYTLMTAPVLLLVVMMSDWKLKCAICQEVLPLKRPLFLYLTRFDPQSSEIKTQAVGH